jgi:pimeloyl-ACP methyl ester carboxylesterase
MARATINGLTLGFEIIGDGKRPWALTPGGRYDRHTAGLRQLAEALARENGRVLIWDRPNCGESDVCFDASTESDLNADALAGLLEHLDMAPALLAGGSAGARVHLLAETRHPGTAQGLALWWPSGGAFELFVLGNVYCTPSMRACYRGGMAEVATLPDWADQIAANPDNRQRILDQDPAVFVETMDRWLRAFIPRDDQVIPGLPDEDLARVAVPALVFNSGVSDGNHPRWVSERLAKLLPRARLVDPPWGDREWHERQAEREKGIFVRWPLLAPQLAAWADQVPAHERRPQTPEIPVSRSGA